MFFVRTQRDDGVENIHVIKSFCLVTVSVNLLWTYFLLFPSIEVSLRLNPIFWHIDLPPGPKADIFNSGIIITRVSDKIQIFLLICLLSKICKKRIQLTCFRLHQTPIPYYHPLHSKWSLFARLLIVLKYWNDIFLQTK